MCQTKATISSDVDPRWTERRGVWRLVAGDWLLVAWEWGRGWAWDVCYRGDRVLWSDFAPSARIAMVAATKSWRNHLGREAGRALRIYQALMVEGGDDEDGS